MSKNLNLRKDLIVKTAIAAVGFFFLPIAVQAATTLYFDLESPVIYKGDTFLINLKVSTPDKPINVVDGTILYNRDKLEIKEISTGDSLFALWPKPPVFSNDESALSFVGGAPEGFQGKEGKVLGMIFSAKSEGEAQINFLDGFSVFLHDGKGTQINPWLRPLSLNILIRPSEIPAKDEWQNLIESDKNPPEPFGILIGQDSFLFDNQYFISFFTTDKESGIDHYEVKEGERDFVRAESPYLLRDQTLRSLIQVKAVDKAGNEIMSELMPALPPPLPLYKNFLFWVTIILIAILFVVHIFWRIFWRKLPTQK